jgi:hypothetical protein
MHLLFLLAVIISFFSFTQKPNLSEVTSTFYISPEYIQKHHIKSITGHFSQKKKNDIIRDSKALRTYFFSPTGHLTQVIELRKNHNDTLSLRFSYDQNDNLILSTRKENNAILIHKFEYDKDNRVIFHQMVQTYLSEKEPNRSSSISETKRFNYQLFENQQKRLTLNDQGTIYREEISYFDQQNRIVKNSDKLLRTSSYKETDYHYSGKKIDSIIISSNQFQKEHQKFTFFYDEKQRLLSKHFYRNNSYVSEQQIIYSQDNGLINYILERDPLNDFISILHLEDYSFYKN